MTKYTSRFAKALLAIGAPFVVFGIVETVLGIAGLGDVPPARTFTHFGFGLAWSRSPEPAILEVHRTRLYQPKSNLRGIVRTDRLGFRGPDRPERHEHLVRIAVLGDSTTFGFGVAYGDSFVGRTASELRARHGSVDVDVIAAACLGYSSFQNRLDLSDRVLPTSPDAVVLCLPGFNDSVGAIEFDDEEWSRVGPARSSRLESLLRHSRLANLIRAARASDESVAPAPPERAPRGSGDRAPIRRVSVEAYQENVRAMILGIRAAGAIPILMTHSFREDLLGEDPYRARYRAGLEAIAHAEQVDLVPGAEALMNGAARFYFDKIHPTEEGHALLAAALVEALDSRLAEVFAQRANRDESIRPSIAPPADPREWTLAQLEPMTLSVSASGGGEESVRFFVGGTPTDESERTFGKFRLTLPPLPRGVHDLEIATRAGSYRIADAVRVDGPDLEVTLREGSAKVVVTAGSGAARAFLHVATDRGDQPMMLRRVFGLKEGAALGAPIEIEMTLDSPGLAAGGFDVPLQAALSTFPRLYLQAIVEPVGGSRPHPREFGIAWPTEVVEIAR